MNINSVSDLTDAYQTSQTSNSSVIAQNFQKLSDALSAGNITDAQSALATYLQSLKNGGTTTTSTNNPVATDLQSLQNALTSGDLTSAQKAFTTLKTDMQSAQSVKGHHHHHKKVSSDEASTNSTTGTSSTTSQNPLQDLISNLTNLQKALSTGNLSDAQSAFDALQKNNSANNFLTGNGQTNQAFQNLKSDLNSGDINSAQSSFSTLIQNLQNSFNGNAVGNIVDANS